VLPLAVFTFRLYFFENGIYTFLTATILFCFVSESNESYFGAYKIGSTVIIPKVSWTTYMLAMTVQASFGF
jgi:hypothetical protein